MLAARDGQAVIYTWGVHQDTGMDIWHLPFWAGGQPKPLHESSFNEFHPSLSPDRKWLAYVSDESGIWQVYLRSHPNPGGVIQVSNAGGMEPVWSPDGKELYYRNFAGSQEEGRTHHRAEKIMAVSFQTDPVLQAGQPRLLFEGDFFFF